MLGGEKIDAWQTAEWKSFVGMALHLTQFESMLKSMMDAGEESS
jgi:hypothetical protein